MKILNKHKLRRMQACVYEVDKITLYNGMDKIEIKDALVFNSYDSICAVYEPFGKRVFCLPRWDYSVTTLRQFKAFIDDFTPLYSKPASKVRAELAMNDIYCEYFSADYYYDAGGKIQTY